MKGFVKLWFVELKLFWREPQALFFTLVFPLIVLFVFGEIFGNEPYQELGGYGDMDISVPGYIGMIIGTTALLGIPVTLASYREQGVLRRLQATPVAPALILAIHVLIYLGMTVLGILLLITAGKTEYDLYLPEAPFAVGVTVLICCLGFFSLGFILAAVVPTARTAQVVGMALFFPMLFMGGPPFPSSIYRTRSNPCPITCHLRMWLNLFRICGSVTDGRSPP